MPRAVLLDIDGTLIDSNYLHARSWSQAFANFGYDVPSARIVREIGKGGSEMLPVFIPNEEERERVGPDIQQFRKGLLWNEYIPQIQPFPQVRELVEKFRERGWKPVIATSAGDEEVAAYLRIANVADLIETGTTSSDAKHAKPHPDIFQAAMERAGVSPEECITLGDTPYDIEASTKAGVRTVCVTTGGWTTAELLAAGAVEVFHDAADLLARFDESVFARG